MTRPNPLESAQQPSMGFAPVAQFFIPAAASLQERRPRTMKHGDTFAVFDHNGDVLSGPGSPEGLYHTDTRHLSHFYLTIGGQRPMLLSSGLRDDNSALICDLTNPDLYDENGELVVEHDKIHLRRVRLVYDGVCFERISVRNYDDKPQRVALGFEFGADFADIFEVRGARRAARGRLLEPERGPRHVRLAYVGLDGLERTTHICFDPAPHNLAPSNAHYVLDLEAGHGSLIFIRIECNGDAPKECSRGAFNAFLRQSRRSLRQSVSRAAVVATSNHAFNDVLCRSVADLYMLMTDTPDGPYPYAGIPWFNTVFGRDALITALETLWIDPGIALGVLRHLAANQARGFDESADAEPGKILHEVRRGEMAELGEVPFHRYYGSIDSTPLFVMLAGAHLQRTGDVASLSELWPNIAAALEWVASHGDRDGDGFVEYYRLAANGLQNQGWKDSGDSIFHADGALAQGPIALCEVQAYVYGAWMAAARIARTLGREQDKREFMARAAALRDAFDRHFFDPELRTYVLALDGEKRPCRVRSSNAGHALFTGIALPARAGDVVRTLMDGALYSGWGVRTIAAGEARFNPMSYHNGSVWPHDNAIIAAGLARYGYRGAAARIMSSLFDALAYMDQHRLPELFCGFSRRGSGGPTFYPVACIPQAWAAAAPLSMLQSCLGLSFHADENTVAFDQPILPEFLDEVVIRNLRMAGANLDVALRRSGEQAVVSVLRRDGDCRVISRL